MPTYVYECSQCQKQFEVDQRITADPLTDCECGGIGTLKRVIQPIAVMFKGSGFHINDYAAKPSASESTTNAKEDSPAVSTDASPSTPSTEASTPKSDPPATSTPATPVPNPTPTAMPD